MWDEAAASDEASWNASIGWAKRRGLPITSRDFHSLAWLQYEWTQQGRFSKTKDAIASVDEALKAPGPKTPDPRPQHAGGHGYGESEIGRGSSEATLRNDRASMRARYIIESERWSEIKGQGNFENIEDLFALGMASVKLMDALRAEAVVGQLRTAAKSPEAELREQAEVMLNEMEALHLFAQGRQQEAFAMMDRAVALQNRMPRPIGRPFPVKGADELYGELLLEANQFKNESQPGAPRIGARVPGRR